MAEQPASKHPDGGKNDTTEYSASKAPETKQHHETPDSRLIPGGPRGSAADVGMSGIEPEDVPGVPAGNDQRKKG